MGWIHGELRYFLDILWNSMKSNYELGYEIRDFDRFGKITQRRIHGIKNNLIWIKIRGDIKEQKLDRKSITKREKCEIKSKINLICDSKL